MGVILNMNRIGEIRDRAEHKADAKAEAKALARKMAFMVIDECKEALAPLKEFGIVVTHAGVHVDNDTEVRFGINLDSAPAMPPFMVRLDFGFQIRQDCTGSQRYVHLMSLMPDRYAAVRGNAKWCHHCCVSDDPESLEEVMGIVSGIISARLDSPLEAFFMDQKERENDAD